MAVRFLATPPMRRAPIASTRACSTASNTARACWPPGACLRCTAGSWQASRSAIESACPRTMAASRSLSRRGGSGRRALPPMSPGRSEAKLTSRSPLPAIALRQIPTARLNGSVGASFAALFGLILEFMLFSLSPLTRRGAFSAQRDVYRTLRQLLSEATLIEFGDQRPLQFVAFVDEGQPEGKADIVEDFRVLGPDDDCTRTHHRRYVAVHECVARQIGDPHHLGNDVATFRRAVVLGLGQHDFDFVVVRQIIEGGDDRPPVHLPLIDLLGAVIEAGGVAQPNR